MLLPYLLMAILYFSLAVLVELWRIIRTGLARIELASSARGDEHVTSGTAP